MQLLPFEDVDFLLSSSYFIAKSLERSPAVGDFYGTGIESWAGFGPNGRLFLPSLLQNLLTYETIIYLKNVSMICGTF